MSAPNSHRSPFIAPFCIGVISLVGLVSALVGDGVSDVVSWAIFSGLIALAVRAWARRDRGR